ncbi:V-type ATP synthase subunit C [Clostridium sp. CM028]|uniref:V-type ATP synthase subunit C n=1 Tax=unclassified Clostridium TaxID=2614128 RepID=UPI001C0C8911|nr:MULTISPECIES: V-type ATP synthase subunit C [unclassified Clostridium]MBU3090613.1 V-type ATP synthase subunit C [Clostridium sp. CF011]MBW9144388.1 V-type ATP synthase subunit C [Clostridium sp. CM027]MBW9149375.1 V-type ATP synthase subunit C [Clostridium sp. CM028]UVE40983.1 V-type ATP synthase subunit C [Clostridium sp. CM027]WAG69965.1 V-type ATP synthase subunit C [Clostridium sp. CF011]
MNNMDFTQAVARLRVLEKRLLSKVKIERMIDSSSADEVLKILKETEYASLMGNVKRAEDYNILLKDELNRVYSLMYEVSPYPSIVDIMSLKYDYHNIKVLLKGRTLDKDFSHMLIPAGTVNIEELKFYMTTMEYKKLDPNMREAIIEVEKVYKELNDPQKIDIILDRYMYVDMLARAEETKIDFIIEYVKKSIDFSNIKSIIRLKKQQKDVNFFKEVILIGGDISSDVLLTAFSDPIENMATKFSSSKYGEVVRIGLEEYIKTGKLSSLEKLSENYIMEKLRAAKYVTFGPEPIFAYIAAKETEIKIIRIITVGKLNNVDTTIIRERMREVYA